MVIDDAGRENDGDLGLNAEDVIRQWMQIGLGLNPAALELELFLGRHSVTCPTGRSPRSLATEIRSWLVGRPGCS